MRSNVELREFVSVDNMVEVWTDIEEFSNKDIFEDNYEGKDSLISRLFSDASLLLWLSEKSSDVMESSYLERSVKECLR